MHSLKLLCLIFLLKIRIDFFGNPACDLSFSPFPPLHPLCLRRHPKWVFSFSLSSCHFANSAEKEEENVFCTHTERLPLKKRPRKINWLEKGGGGKEGGGRGETIKVPPREKLKGKHIWQTKTPFYPTLPPPFFCRPFLGMEGEGELLSAAVHLKTFSSTSILLSFFVTKSSPPPPPPPFPFSRWIRRGFLPDERRASASLLLLKSPPLIKIVSGKKGALSNFLPISFLYLLFYVKSIYILSNSVQTTRDRKQDLLSHSDRATCTSVEFDQFDS